MSWDFVIWLAIRDATWSGGICGVGGVRRHQNTLSIINDHHCPISIAAGSRADCTAGNRVRIQQSFFAGLF